MQTESHAHDGSAPGSHRRDRIEVLLSRSVGVVGIVFGAMALPTALGQRELLQPLWFTVTLSAMYGSLVASMVASVVQRGVRAANVVVSVVWQLTMLLWPLFMVDANRAVDERPWPWFLASVAVAAAAVVYTRVRRSTIYLLVAVAVYGYVRVLPSGGAAPWDEMVLDCLSTITFGGAVITIVTAFRRAATAVDEAQFTALQRHAEAATQHAVSRERVRVDALVHDSVLTTLREAARASTPESMGLVARMAAEAIGHLEAASDDSRAPVQYRAADEFVERLRGAVAQLGGGATLRVGDVQGVALPIEVADALHSAAMQAFVNSLQHAGAAASRWLTVGPIGVEGIRIEVGDTGVGFVLDRLPSERIGLRVSILERVTAVGGAVELDSQPGEGTIVTLEWPHGGAV